MSNEQKSLECFLANGKSRNEEQNKQAINRQCHETYFKYGFIETGYSHTPTPFCILCDDRLSIEVMKPSKLLRHINTNHPGLKNNPLDYFEGKKLELDGPKKCLRAITSIMDNALRASYFMATRIAKSHSLSVMN